MEKSKKKILIFIDWFLPGYKAGGPVRSMANMVDHLSDTYDFYMVTRNTEYLETTPYPNVYSNVWVDFKPGVKVFYASADCEGYGLWRQLIRKGAFDAVYINGIYSFKYSILPLLAAKKLKVSCIVVAPRGMLGAGAIQLKHIKKIIFLHLVNKFHLYWGIRWHATAETEEQEIFKNFGKSSNVMVAPNLNKKTEGELKLIPIVKTVNELRICFISRISRKKNLSYALKTLSLITNKEANIVFDIFGTMEDKSYWDECHSMISCLPINVEAKYCGVLMPEQIFERISKYHVLFFPTLHENFGHVILESLMAGRPVLISDQTPWRELSEKKAGWDLTLEDIVLFTDQISNLVRMNQVEYEVYCKGAFQLASDFISDKSLLLSYEKLFHFD